MRSPTLRRDVPRTVGRYELADLLGEGASGEVWRATDPSIGRPVAVKLFRVPEGFGAAQRAEWEQRFLLEARAAGQLSHPGIVSVHDVGTTPEGRPFIVMELVEGRSLEAIRRADAPVPMDRLIDWMAQVADALDAAHRRGIVHRDVKPANILVDADGRARIADFGVARLPDSEMTREGAFLGSPAFAAPEQIRGAEVDGRADLFSLGAVLYGLATGRRPFDGPDIAALAYAVCHADAPPPRSLNAEIGPALEAVMLRALAKTPDARYPTGADMARALREALAGDRAPHAEPTEPSELERTLVAAPARTRIPRAWRLGAVLAVAGVAVGIAVLVGGRKAVPDRPPVSPSAAVRVVAMHRLEEGTLEVRLDGDRVVRERLTASRREPFGVSVLAYRKGMQSWSIRVPAGDHRMQVAVTGPERKPLSREIDVRVDPEAAYLLEIAVGTWPKPKLAVDWNSAEE